MADVVESLEDARTEHSSVQDEHLELPFRLSDISINSRFADIHPIFETIDTVRHEWKFQFKLLLKEWKFEHWLGMSTGIIAFILGAISGEILSGGDAKLIGTVGMSSVGGFDYFQLMLSIVLWLWFMVQMTTLFPIMRGHLINLMIIWGSIMAAEMLFHVSAPNFPSGIAAGDMLGGVILMAIAIFFTYFFWKAVSETRDLHVQEHHVHPDVRVMEIAVKEHSLRGWFGLLCGWILIINLNAWSGSHFIADRHAERIFSLIIHLISGMFGVSILMVILWYPQRMLGKGVVVKTKAASAGFENQRKQDVAISHEGQCPSCQTKVAAKRTEEGELVIMCTDETCSGWGTPGEKCTLCETDLQTRISCKSCGMNASVIDFFPDMEAW